MKNLLLSIAIFSSCAIHAQDLKHSKSGFEPIVFQVEGKKSSEIYAKTKEWINVTYDNPTEVIKADTENKMLRINGYDGMFTYQITVDIKEEKYRLSISNVVKLANKSPLEMYLKKDGSVRKMGAGQYNKAITSLTDIAKSLHKSMTEESEEW